MIKIRFAGMRTLSSLNLLLSDFLFIFASYLWCHYEETIIIFDSNPRTFYQRILKDNPNDEVAKWLVENCRKSQEEMVKMEDGKSVKDFPISPLPKKTAIVIDKNTASSAETLIRYAKMCCDTTRTKVYGKEDGFFGLQTNYNNS